MPVRDKPLLMAELETTEKASEKIVTRDLF
jgi:hypothetical protein